MTKTLTISVCRRPGYTRQTLLAVRACIGVEDYAVAVMVDRQSDATLAVVEEVRLPAWEVHVSDGPLGCNASIRRSLEWGFARSDFHVHLEDDTVPAKDFLSFMEWGRRFGTDSSVLSVAGWSKIGGNPQYAVSQRWFTPWGWGTWLDRWQEVEPTWEAGGPESWDCRLARMHLGDRVEVVPALSRIQNIGRDGGTHNTPELWEREQFTPHFAGETHEVREFELT
jgi:hypothetical protein